MRVSIWLAVLMSAAYAQTPTPVININFGLQPFTGAAVIGAPTDKWNNAPSATIANLPLLDRSGAPTSATLTCTANGLFSSLVFGFSSTPYATLMGSYVYSLLPQPGSVSYLTAPDSLSIAGLLPNSTYVAYIYSQGDTASSGRTLSITTAAGATVTSTPAASTASTFILNQNYLIVPVTSDVNGVVSFTFFGTGPNEEGDINGLQLVGSLANPSPVITMINNSASGVSGQIAPGEMVSIYGSLLGPLNAASYSVVNGMVGTTLGGTSVLFGSIPAPILYASVGQINAIVPFEVNPNTPIQIVVLHQGLNSTPFSATVANVAPGVFTDNTGQATALNQDVTFNSAAHPAVKGSYVSVYFTGGGQTSPASVTGAVGSPGQILMQNVTVTVGSVPANVTFAGPVPGVVSGYDQVNFQLADNTPSGSQPVVITIDGSSSQSTATLAVQ